MLSDRKLYPLRAASRKDVMQLMRDTRTDGIIDSISACKMLYAGAVKGESAIILLRSRLLSVAQRMGFSEVQRENMALVASEMVSNQIKHAQLKGQIQIWQQPGPTLDILALDHGQGIPNLSSAQRDGFSTAKTLGKGLGSIQRLADDAAIYTNAALHENKWTGTAVLARFCVSRSAYKGADEPVSIGLFSRALSDDRYNGDRIYLKRDGEKLRWLHLDGLGHGENAQNTTADLADHLLDKDPAAALEAVDKHLQGTRGAVAVIGEIHCAPCKLQLLGVGDMHAAVFNHGALRKISFSPGILGLEHNSLTPPLREAFEHCSVVITASDGIRRSWDESAFPGLFSQPPQLIAYVLGNIMGRISDDQSLCVVGIR